jgi:hypothetical protein
MPRPMPLVEPVTMAVRGIHCSEAGSVLLAPAFRTRKVRYR